MILKKVAVAMISGALSAGVLAADLQVSEAWVRGTVPAQKSTGAFMALSSKSGARIVGASSPAAGVTEIHSMSMEGGVMRMRAIPVLEVPAGETVELKPGGYHVMLMQLKAPVTEGATVPIVLLVEGADKKIEEVAVQAAARSLSAGADAIKREGMMNHEGMKMPH